MWVVVRHIVISDFPTETAVVAVIFLHVLILLTDENQFVVPVGVNDGSPTEPTSDVRALLRIDEESALAGCLQHRYSVIGLSVDRVAIDVAGRHAQSLLGTSGFVAVKVKHCHGLILFFLVIFAWNDRIGKGSS